jgi:hypothetical protein
VKKEGPGDAYLKTPDSGGSRKRTKQLAKKAEVEAVYHKRDGTIKDKDSYGNDPNPPKDRKH